jgi:hypothetical protein
LRPIARDARYEDYHRMNTAGHLHNPASELPAIRSAQPWAFLATLAGALVLAASMALNLDAVPELPAKIILGVSLPVFVGAALGAIPPTQPKPAVHPDPRSDDATPPADTDDVQRPSEDERVHAWRKTRLTALGVPEEVALVLAEDPSFSHHELKRLLGHGCPLGTALRILQPD